MKNDKLRCLYARKRRRSLYISCIPWIHYTHFIRTYEDADKDNLPGVSGESIRTAVEG